LRRLRRRNEKYIVFTYYRPPEAAPNILFRPLSQKAKLQGTAQPLGAGRGSAKANRWPKAQRGQLQSAQIVTAKGNLRHVQLDFFWGILTGKFSWRYSPMFDEELFIIAVYCLIDEIYHRLFPNGVRHHGFEPQLSDVEALTIAIVGEYLGLAQDKAIFEYFFKHYRDWFPGLSDRTLLVRQWANLWVVEQHIWQELVRLSGADQSTIQVIDTLPVPICGLRRYRRRRIFCDDGLWCTNLDNWAGLRYNDYYEEEKTFPTPATKTAKAEKEDPEDPLPGEKLAGIRPGSGPTGRSDPLDYR
jgi:hypothetical protein